MLDTKMKELIQKEFKDALFDEPLDRHTTIRVGGPADVLLHPENVADLERILHLKLPIFVLGAGSNVLVSDKGLRGLVVSLQKFSRMTVEQTTTLYVEAGVGIPRMVDFSAEHGLTGLEPLAGIPGNVGGGLVMNAGTPTGEIGDHVMTVTFIDKEGRLQTWDRERIDFGYRSSHFPKGVIILSARFELKSATVEQVKGVIKAARDARVQTQPLNVPNLGSVFKNPKPEPGQKKFAGALIEEAGLKGVRVGGARISPKHGNFIVNEGGATAKDIKVLIGLIRDKVKEKFGVVLETEVRIVGEA